MKGNNSNKHRASNRIFTVYDKMVLYVFVQIFVGPDLGAKCFQRLSAGDILKLLQNLCKMATKKAFNTVMP